jgi:hypothetical protein
MNIASKKHTRIQCRYIFMQTMQKKCCDTIKKLLVVWMVISKPRTCLVELHDLLPVQIFVPENNDDTRTGYTTKYPV